MCSEVFPALISQTLPIKMAKLLQIALVPVAAHAVFTPQGERSADCIVQVPETAVVKTHDTGISLHHDDGRVEHITTPQHCHTDDVAVALAQRDQNQWIDEAGFTYNPGFSKMTGYNNIPDAPQRGGQIVYYFLGMQNMEGGPVSILQPVLAYEGNEWTCLVGLLPIQHHHNWPNHWPCQGG